MTTNDKPVCYQYRYFHDEIGDWIGWFRFDTPLERDYDADLFRAWGRKVETRDLYARPQPAAPQVPDDASLGRTARAG